MNATTQNTWTSYRDGRRVMHYMRADGGRYFVQKVEAGYKVSFLANEGDGVSIHMTTEPTLKEGKRWVEAYTGVTFDAAFTPEEHPTLADCAAKFEDKPLYECEIPGAPGHVTLAACKAAVGEPLTRDTDTKGLPPGTYTATLEAAGVAPSGDIIASAIVHGFGSRCIQIVGRCQRIRPHRPKTYKPHALGIDTFKVLRTDTIRTYEDGAAFDRQDASVCRIEQELLQYAGKRRTPHRNRKVDKLRKILRILKRGLYE